MQPFRWGSGHPTSACSLAGTFTRLSKGKVPSWDSLSVGHHEDSQRVPPWPPSSYTRQGRRTAAYSRSTGTVWKTRSCAAAGTPGCAPGQGKLLPRPLGRSLGVLARWDARPRLARLRRAAAGRACRLQRSDHKGKNKVHWLINLLQVMAFRSNFFFLNETVKKNSESK